MKFPAACRPVTNSVGMVRQGPVCTLHTPIAARDRRIDRSTALSSTASIRRPVSRRFDDTANFPDLSESIALMFVLAMDRLSLSWNQNQNAKKRQPHLADQAVRVRNITTT